jgi:UDP-GlcNAc:undecaprenyl-phosphate GlcNAc-1-phosphate transferase
MVNNLEMLNFEPYLHILPNIFSAALIALIITPLLRYIGLRYGFSTKPKSESDPNERNFEVKHHNKIMPRLGEFAMLIPLAILMWRNLQLGTQVFGIVMAILMIGILGAMDSKKNLSEFVKLYILFFAGLILIFTGTVIDIHSIINFQSIDPTIINNPITQSQLSMFSVLLTLAWIYIIPTALSYVGGVDGLSEGTSAIAILILTLIGIRTGDLITITIGSLCLGGLIGLLPYNFYPAVIFSEHLIYGFVIAILAITSQAKISTALLLLTFPLIDFLYISIFRARKYFKQNTEFHFITFIHYLGTGDRNHFHHKLMAIGFSPVKISLIQYLIYAMLGFLALVVSGLYLTVSILGTVGIIVLIFYWINKKLK